MEPAQERLGQLGQIRWIKGARQIRVILHAKHPSLALLHGGQASRMS